MVEQHPSIFPLRLLLIIMTLRVPLEYLIESNLSLKHTTIHERARAADRGPKKRAENSKLKTGVALRLERAWLDRSH